MKRKLVVLLAMITGIVFALGGCGGSDKDADLSEMDLSKYLTVGDYIGLEVEKPKEIKVTDDDIQAEIDDDLQANAKLTDVKDGKVHDGDTVNIDFVGKMDGKEFEGGSGEGETIVIGSDNFIDGFADGLIGKKVGDTVDLDLTFPEEYPNNPSLAGKPVVFTVTINSAQYYKKPKYDDKYITETLKQKSKKAYEKKLKENLIAQKEQEQENEVKAQLFQKLMDISEVSEYPENLMEEYKTTQKAAVENYAEQYSMDLKDYLQQTSGITEEEYDEQLEESAKEYVKSQMVTEYVAQKEELKVTEKEYEDYLKHFLSYYDMDDEEAFKAQTGMTVEEYMGGEDAVKFMLNKDKVMDFLKENCKYV